MEGASFKSIMHLSYRNFRSIPEELCGPERHNIEEIYLKENLIYCLPDWFLVQMGHLRFLCLAGNMINSLPDRIDRLVCLETLDLSENLLHRLPPTIGRLERLINLLLNGNYIDQLPLEIGQLQKLEVLQVRKNRLTNIPVQLAQCTALEDLQLDDNPGLVSIPTRLFNLPALSYVSAERCNLFQLPFTINTTTLSFVLLFRSLHSLTHCPLALERFAQPDYESKEQKAKRIKNPPCYRPIRCHAVPYLLNFPSELVHLCNRHDAPGILPNLLFETALRAYSGNLRWDSVDKLDLPRCLTYRLIHGPVGCCSSVPCGREIFTTAVLALVKSSKEYAQNIIVSVLFCSKLCADRWFQYNCDAYEELSWELPN